MHFTHIQRLCADLRNAIVANLVTNYQDGSDANDDVSYVRDESED